MTEQQKQRIQKEMQKQVDQIFAADADANGVIEGSELYNPPNAREGDYPGRRGSVPFALALLKADPNGDGVLTQIEATLLASQSLEGIDAELLKNQEKRQGESALGMQPTCPTIKVPNEDQLVLFGSYEGTSISTVSVAGQDDVTLGGTIFIEDGTRPLTVFLSSYNPMIWQFTGATQRVSKVVAFGGLASGDRNAKPAVGIVGIDKAKLQFIGPELCFRYFYKSGSPEELKAKTVVERMTGRAPDVVLGQYGITVAALPSGSGMTANGDRQDEATLQQLVAKAKPKYFTVGEGGKLVPLEKATNGSSAESELLRFNPTGLMDFKPTDIVSEAKVEPYAVLPQHAGLMQLEAQGKITHASGNPAEWKINQPIHFPPGLAGALSTTYLLPKGIAMPEGDPGHSCVYVEGADGKVSGDGATCR